MVTVRYRSLSGKVSKLDSGVKVPRTCPKGGNKIRRPLVQPVTSGVAMHTSQHAIPYLPLRRNGQEEKILKRLGTFEPADGGAWRR